MITPASSSQVLLTETGWATNPPGGNPPCSQQDKATWTTGAYTSIWLPHTHVMGVMPFMLQVSRGCCWSHRTRAHSCLTRVLCGKQGATWGNECVLPVLEIGLVRALLRSRLSGGAQVRIRLRRYERPERAGIWRSPGTAMQAGVPTCLLSTNFCRVQLQRSNVRFFYI